MGYNFSKINRNSNLNKIQEDKHMKPTYIVKRVEKPEWEKIEAVTLHHQPWLTPNTVEAKAQMCHDGEKFFVRMTAKEEKIRAELTDVLSQVCNDSCLEFFFAPDCGMRYFNFEWNPLGTLYLGFGAARNTRVRLIVKDKDALFAPKPFTTANGWGIEFEIPASFIQMYFPAFDMSEARANFYKCGDKTEVPHYLAWSDLTSEKPDYHRAGDFGDLYFK